MHVMNLHEDFNYKTLELSSKSNRLFEFSIVKHECLLDVYWKRI